MFIKTTKGIKTPSAIYESLKKSGHLLSIQRDVFVYGFHKIFEADNGDIYDVLIVDGEVMYANKIPKWEKVVKAYVPDFGGF